MRNKLKWLLALGVATVLLGAITLVSNNTKEVEQKLNKQIEMLEHRTKQQQNKEVENLNKQIQDLNIKLQSKAAEKARLASLEAARATVAQKVVNTIVPTANASQRATSASQNETIAWNFLIANGFTRNQTAGIMGNLQQEHGFQTSDVRGGLGIAQWIGGRRTALMSRPNYLDINVQLQFMLDELNGSNAHAGAAVRASATIEQAVRAFQNLYERCGICNEGARVQYAHAINARH